MQLKDFIGKPLISAGGQRLLLTRITAPYLQVVTDRPTNGHHTFYRYDTINGDPISKGVWVFEDPTLKAPFLRAYNAHCRSQAGYCEEIGYWMRKD